MRQANLAHILQIIHRSGPRSRAELTEATGLNRSTIADLIADLVEQDLATESAPHPAGRVGRPSPIVSTDPRVVAIAVNPEVDALTMAAVRLDREIAARTRIDVAELMTPEGAARLVAAQIAQWRAHELADHRIVGIGVAVPGLVRAADGIVRDAPHLRWRDVSLRELLVADTGLDVSVGNDATLGIMAEHLFGAARGIDDVVYLNGGASGIGGGLVVHGIPVVGAGGYAGEFGQNRPRIGDDADRRTQDGVLEDEVSRARLLDAVGLAAADEPTLARTLAESGSSEVHDEIARQRRILATALANATNVLNPRMIVLGGFLATLAASDIGGLEAAVRGQAMAANGEDLKIRPAALGEDRLLIGAAETAFAALLRDPLSASAEAPSSPVGRASSAAADASSPASRRA